MTCETYKPFLNVHVKQDVVCLAVTPKKLLLGQSRLMFGMKDETILISIFHITFLGSILNNFYNNLKCLNFCKTATLFQIEVTFL